MRRLLLTLSLCLVSLLSVCQNTKIFYYTKKDIAPAIIKCSASFLSGFVGKSTNETIDHSYPYFQATFPNANPQYCNPDLSWVNKYKNHDPTQGYNSLWSKHIGVVYSDLYHLSNMFDTGLYTFGCLLPIGNREITFRKHTVKFLIKYSVEGTVLWFCRDLGFETSRKFIYKIK